MKSDLRRAVQALQEIRSRTTLSEDVRKQKESECEEKVAYYEGKDKESMDFVRLLLANGQIDPDEKTNLGTTAWDCAISRKAMKIAALLTGSNPEEDELAALHGNMDVFQAIYNQNLTALEALLRSGVELQTVCEHKGDLSGFYGLSPLACAMSWFDRYPEPADMLLDAGADPNYRFGNEDTAFEIASKIRQSSTHIERYTAFLEKMLRHGWDIDACRQGGEHDLGTCLPQLHL